MVRSKGEKGYQFCIHIILSLVSLSMILPVLLWRMSVHVDALALHAEHVGWASDMGPYSTLSLHMAMAFLLVLPVLLVYPFIWKPLVSGLTLGIMKK